MQVLVTRGIAAAAVLFVASTAWSQLAIHYTFDNALAGTATNSAGANGTIVGNSVYSASAAVGQRSLSFDGTDDYVTTNINLGSVNNYTMSFWYNTAIGQACCGNGALYYTNGPWGGTGDEVHSSLTNSSAAIWQEINSGNQRTSGNAATPLNNWNHVVASFDNGNITYFVNGVQSPAGSQTMSGPTARLGSGQIGAWDGTRDYNGSFDDWAIWTEALNAAESTAIYNLANSSLDYNAGNADTLFGVFDGEVGSATINGLRWVVAPNGTLVGTPGQVLNLGNGNFGVVLNSNGGGVQTAAVPEPSTLIAWMIFGISAVGYVRWRRRRA